MTLPYAKQKFGLRDLAFWVRQHKPTQIEMNDGQDAWFCNLNGMPEDLQRHPYRLH